MPKQERDLSPKWKYERHLAEPPICWEKKQLLVAKIDKKTSKYKPVNQRKHKDDTLIWQFAKENPFSIQLQIQTPVSF